MRKPSPPKPSISIFVCVCLFSFLHGPQPSQVTGNSAPGASVAECVPKTHDEQTQDLGAASWKRAFYSPKGLGPEFIALCLKTQFRANNGVSIAVCQQSTVGLRNNNAQSSHSISTVPHSWQPHPLSTDATFKPAACSRSSHRTFTYHGVTHK